MKVTPLGSKDGLQAPERDSGKAGHSQNGQDNYVSDELGVNERPMQSHEHWLIPAVAMQIAP